MNIEDLKMKAGAEYKEKVRLLTARFDEERKALDEAYDAKCKVLDALAGVSTEQVSEVLAWAGVDTPKLRQSVSSAPRKPRGYQVQRVRDFVRTVENYKEFRMEEVLAFDEALTFSGAGRAMESLVASNVVRVVRQEPSPHGGRLRNVYQKL